MGSPFDSLKAELMQDRSPRDPIGSQVRPSGLIKSFHNRQRLHEAIGYKAPADMEQLAATA